MSTLENLANAIEHGKKKEALPLLEAALAEGIDPQSILSQGLIAPMDVVGEKFSRNEVFVPEVLMSARAMSACADLLKPRLVEEGAEPLGKAVIGTVKGDMHDIGKNLVRMMLEAKGFEVTDLGTDVAPEAFVAWLEANPDGKVVCLSALLTTTMPVMADIVKAVHDGGFHDKGVRVFIGGAPVTQGFCDEIGADFYTKDAAACAACAAAQVA